MLRREQRELRCVSFRATFCSDVDEEAMILGVPATLCARLGQGPESGVNKKPFRTRLLTLLGTHFRVFRHFVTLDFSFSFEVTSDSELCALWWPKGAHEEVFGDPFSKRFRG